jgi:hypothetical protein
MKIGDIELAQIVWIMKSVRSEFDGGNIDGEPDDVGGV